MPFPIKRAIFCLCDLSVPFYFLSVCDMKALFYIIFLHVILGSNCARILAGFPVDSISHIHSTAAYLKRLADDGHEITVLHYGKMKKVELNHPNINTYYSYMESDEDVITFVNSFLWKKSRFGIGWILEWKFLQF